MVLKHEEQRIARRQQRAVILPARKMGCRFEMKSFVDKRRNAKGYYKQGWGWYYYPEHNRDGRDYRKHYKAKSNDACDTKYEAAQDFLKWALINL